MDNSHQVVEQIFGGEVRAAARLMRELDDGRPAARETLKHLYRHSGRAHIIGITGSPGVGKSTLTDRLIQYLRQAGQDRGGGGGGPHQPLFRRRHPGGPHPHAAPRHWMRASSSARWPPGAISAASPPRPGR